MSVMEINGINSILVMNCVLIMVWLICCMVLMFVVGFECKSFDIMNLEKVEKMFVMMVFYSVRKRMVKRI